jgi:hypothetical protein
MTVTEIVASLTGETTLAKDTRQAVRTAVLS